MNNAAAVVRRWVAVLATALLTVGLLASSPAGAVPPESRATTIRVDSTDHTAAAQASTCEEARQAAKKAKKRHRKATRAFTKAKTRTKTLTRKLKKARKAGNKTRVKKLKKQLRKHFPGAVHMSLRNMQLTLSLVGNRCLHAGGDAALEAWLDEWVWAGAWRSGCT